MSEKESQHGFVRFAGRLTGVVVAAVGLIQYNFLEFAAGVGIFYLANKDISGRQPYGRVSSSAG